MSTRFLLALAALALAAGIARADDAHPRTAAADIALPGSLSLGTVVGLDVPGEKSLIDEVRLGGLLRLGGALERRLAPHERELEACAPTRALAAADVIFRDDATVRAALSWNGVLGGLREDRPDTGKDRKISLEEVYFELRSIGGTPLWGRLGRQAISRGTGMLLGEDEEQWRRTHDAALVAWETPTFVLQAFWERLAHRDRPGIGTGAFTGDVDFVGVYATERRHEEIGFDLYALHRHDGGKTASAEDRATFGARAFGRLADLVEYSFEGALQLGRTQTAAGESARIFAWAGEGLVSLDLRRAPLAPRITLHAALATGDKNPFDHRATTFDPLFEDGHGRFGLSDLVVLENLRALGGRFALRPTEQLLVECSTHVLWVDEPNDTAAPRLFAGKGRPTNHRGLGNEVSARVRLEPLDYLAVECGASALVPGAYTAARLESSSVIARGYAFIELRY